MQQQYCHFSGHMWTSTFSGYLAHSPAMAQASWASFVGWIKTTPVVAFSSSLLITARKAKPCLCAQAHNVHCLNAC